MTLLPYDLNPLHVYLTRLAVTNFRCFEQIELTELDRLVVLVGENDAGKSVLLEAISVLAGATALSDDHLRQTAEEETARSVEVAGTFRLEPQDTVPAEFRVGEGANELRLRRKHTTETTEVFAWVLGFDDPEYDDFSGADRQKELLRKAGLSPAGKEADRRAQFDELILSGTLKRTTEREVKLSGFGVLAGHMPRIERIASNEYKSPDAMIQRTLQSVAAGIMKPIDATTGQATEAPELASMRAAITSRLNEELGKAREVLGRVHPQLRGLRAEPIIDFTRAVSTSALTADIGSGERLLSAFGEGTKKRMWMGLLEWEQQAARANVAGSVLRLYDEPDVNLHYHAQRHLFASISGIACDEALHTQCFVCTHAVTLIDRAPCESINVIQVDADGSRRVFRIGAGSEPEVMDFFNEVGRAVGLTNSILLYERAFLLVEGESEAEALPILYRMLFKRSMHEDGIVLVNLRTCSAWPSVMEVMLKNRIAITHLLLDADCQEPESSARINLTSLTKFGCGQEFLDDQVTFIGDKEYEDAFSDGVIAGALDAEFPRVDGMGWLERVIELKALSLGTGKFSEALQRAVQKECVPVRRSDVSKPNLAAAVARRCSGEEDTPAAIIAAFTAVRERAGLESPITEPGVETEGEVETDELAGAVV